MEARSAFLEPSRNPIQWSVHDSGRSVMVLLPPTEVFMALLPAAPAEETRRLKKRDSPIGTEVFQSHIE
jgi:hypothetical protein